MDASDVCLVCLDLGCIREGWQLAIKDNLVMEYSRSFDEEQIKTSTAAGCSFCQVFCDGLELMSGLLANTSHPFRGRLIVQPGQPPEVEIFSHEDNKIFNARIQYHTVEGSTVLDPKWAPFGIAKAFSSEVSLEQCSRVFLNWIRNCDKYHPKCSVKSGMRSHLPSRVLDVQARADKSVVLVDTRISRCDTNQYATLSHCWGNYKFIQTTTNSLEARLKYIEWKSLPRTFQDATSIARALGIQYLWIDSLCIIQDDDLDWKQECARMSSVYSNSYVNIAATGAVDGRGGCLSPRTIECGSQTFGIESRPIKQRGFDQPKIFVRPSFEHIHHQYSTNIKHYSSSSDTESAPLLSRAWVFQERYLAPRTLHFHPSEVILECQTGLRCECSGLDSIKSRPRHDSVAQDFTAQNNWNKKQQYDNWFSAVEEFSRLSLTRQSDRLVALIGVATVVQEKLGDDYLAGLWKGDIARGLLWHITRPPSSSQNGLARRHESIFTPTWSWASLILDTRDVGIVFPASHDDSFAPDKRLEFLQTNLPPEAAMSSQSANGVLRVKGPVVTAIMCEQDPEISQSQRKDKILIFEGEIDSGFVLISFSGFNIDILSTEETEASKETYSLVHCLIVGSKIDEYDAGYEESENNPEYFCAVVLSFLILGAYERIGVLDIKKESLIYPSSTFMELDLI